MKIISLKVSDFCCFSDFVLPLENQGLVLVTGDNKDTDAAVNNGCGKSTVFKALTWGLYGETIDGERGDKVIRDGQESASVTITMMDEDGRQWAVLRERKKGAPSLQVYVDGAKLSASKEETQEAVIEALGLDFKAFKNTVLYGQNDSARFAHPKTKDSERKRMLHRILRTGVLEKCHGAVLKKRKGLREEITAIDAKVSIPKAKLEDINIDAMKIIDQVGGMSFENPGKELGEVEDEISELEKIKSGLSKAEEEHEKAREKADLSTSLRASAKLCLVEVSADVKTNAGQLSKLKGGICPTCTADLKKGDSTKYVKKLKAERKKLIAEKSELKKELATFESKEEEAHDQINEAFSKVAECRDAQLEIDKLLVKVGELKESKTKYSFEKMKLKASAKACVDLARAELYRIKKM